MLTLSLGVRGMLLVVIVDSGSHVRQERARWIEPMIMQSLMNVSIFHPESGTRYFFLKIDVRLLGVFFIQTPDRVVQFGAGHLYNA
jgi:hypothetical protein